MANDVEHDQLEDARQRFIALWAHMGSSWGIPRTMAEVHALLFIEGEPMHTAAVMEALGVSRGSASTTLRALAEWGLLRRVHRRGDRKEYFEAEQDVWNMFRIILRERKKREIDPLLEELRECREMAGPDSSGTREAEHRRRLDDMIEFVSLVEAISQRFINPSGGLRLAAKILSKAS
jgi:DNA-binding transcriptional regulator GbsR (MarR family)